MPPALGRPRRSLALLENGPDRLRKALRGAGRVSRQAEGCGRVIDLMGEQRRWRPLRLGQRDLDPRKEALSTPDTSGLHKRICSLYVLTMSAYVSIAGAPFLALHHHDGRMIRGGGLFVFARRTGPRRTILHMELAEMISQRAGTGHPRWEWALAGGLNELL